jgi:hypothetical protein
MLAAIMVDAHVDQRTTIIAAHGGPFRKIALTAQWDTIRAEPTSIFS